jgi:hypothetical protein
VSAGGIAATVQLLEDGRPGEKVLASQVVSRLAEDDALREQILAAPEVMSSLVDMMKNKRLTPSAQITAAQAIAPLVTTASGQAAACEMGMVSALLGTLDSKEGVDGDGSVRSHGLELLQQLVSEPEQSDQDENYDQAPARAMRASIAEVNMCNCVAVDLPTHIVAGKRKSFSQRWITHKHANTHTHTHTHTHTDTDTHTHTHNVQTGVE